MKKNYFCVVIGSKTYYLSFITNLVNNRVFVIVFDSLMIKRYINIINLDGDMDNKLIETCINNMLDEQPKHKTEVNVTEEDVEVLTEEEFKFIAQ